jgi:hypothetical protein
LDRKSKVKGAEMNTYYQMMNNYWLMRLATQNSGGNTPASEESIMILGGVLLLLVLLLIAFCVCMWWDSHPTIDVYRDYENHKPNQSHVAEDLPQEPQEPRRTALTMSAVLGIAGVMSWAMKETGMLKALLSTDIENGRSTSDHNTNNKKKGLME